MENTYHEENPPIEEDFNPWDEKERLLHINPSVMVFKLTIPGGTKIEIGQTLPLTHNFDQTKLLGVSVIKEIISDTEILVESHCFELALGGIINNGSFELNEVSIVPKYPRR